MRSTKSAKEVDAANVSNKEAEGLKKRGEQFLEVRTALEVPMQDTGTARERMLAKGVGFGNRTCSCEFRVNEKESFLPGCLGSRTHPKRRRIRKILARRFSEGRRYQAARAST